MALVACQPSAAWKVKVVTGNLETLCTPSFVILRNKVYAAKIIFSKSRNNIMLVTSPNVKTRRTRGAPIYSISLTAIETRVYLYCNILEDEENINIINIIDYSQTS
jgi:hypothetical protein